MGLLSACADPATVEPDDTSVAACEPQQEVAYDGIDQDCDGGDLIDVDGDGWPAAEVGGEDCDDGDPEVNPYADEVCNGVDDDCDGLADGADDSLTDGADWCPDADGDSYGDVGSLSHECFQPQGYVADCSDCDDGDPAVNPGATEVCDGQDNDCDGLTDGQDGDLADGTDWCLDADGDGYGDAGSTSHQCSQPQGYVADCSDCDDGDAATGPCGSGCAPIVDTGFTTITPDPDADLVVVREQFHSYLDLTHLGRSAYSNIQSLYLRFHEGTREKYYETQQFDVQFSSGITIEGYIWESNLPVTDPIFGVSEVTDYECLKSSRGFEAGSDGDTTDDKDSVYDDSSDAFSLEWITDASCDDVRVLITYADPSSCETVSISMDPSGEIGIIVGDPASGVTDAADYGETTSVSLALSE